ncbi:MAG: hypothetical protein U5J99_01175 [Parvularculaceae bacterium]|nr:hypothetical protein [Parvularculaceae bacterium]
MRSLLAVFGAITDAFLAAPLALFVAGDRMGALPNIGVFLSEALPLPSTATAIVMRVPSGSASLSVLASAALLYFLVRIVLGVAAGAVALAAAGRPGRR